MEGVLRGFLLLLLHLLLFHFHFFFFSDLALSFLQCSFGSDWRTQQQRRVSVFLFFTMMHTYPWYIHIYIPTYLPTTPADA